MKHLKKLSVVLMITTLFSTSFTSCIDNEVSPIVEAIYEAQADLIAAQTAVQNAEATLLAAQAAQEQANAAYTTAMTAQVTAMTAGIVEGNAYTAAVHEQELLALVAQTNLDVANATNDLALAQAQFDLDMADLLAELDQANVQLAIDYAYDYRNAMTTANSIWSSLLTAKNTLADAQLMLTGTAGSEVSYAYHLASLQTAVEVAQANADGIQANLDLLKSHAADPIVALEALKLQKTALTAEYQILQQERAAQVEVINSINFDVSERNTYVAQLTGGFGTPLWDHNSAISQKLTREASITAAELLITGYETAITNYAGVTTSLTLAKTNANLAKTNAATAVTTANGLLGDQTYGTPVLASTPKTGTSTLTKVAWNTHLDLIKLQNEVAGLYGTYQTAIADYYTQQDLYNSGLPGLTSALTTAQGNLTTLEGALLAAQIDYNTKLGLFEGSPAGFVWFAGVDGILGIHPTALTTTATYKIATAIAPVVVGASTVSAGSGANLTANGTYASFLSGTMTDSTPVAVNDYYNIAADDVAGGTYADRLDAAVIVLGNAIAVDPVLGDTPIASTGLYSDVWNAQLVEITAQDALDNSDVNLLAAKAEYFRLKGIYDGQVILVAAAQLAKDNAATAVTTAATALGDLTYGTPTAASALKTGTSTLTKTAWNTHVAALIADAALATHLATTVAMYEAMIVTQEGLIADWTEQIAALDVYIAAKYAVVADLLGQLTDLGIEYTFVADADGKGTFEVTNDTNIGNSYSDLRAELIAENQVLWNLDREIAVLSDSRSRVNDLISAWNASYNTFVNTTIPNLEASLVLAEKAVNQAQAALALATNDQTAATANIAYYASLVETLELRHANALAIAAKYKALMDAALAL